MKILFAALKYDYGIQARGESLELRAFYPALKKNCELTVAFWLEENGYPENLNTLQDKLVQFAEIEKPDYIFFILMNFEIYPKTLQKLKEKYITINWFCDDAWRFDSFTRLAAENFTFYVTVDKYSLSKYQELNYKNVILSQWACFDYKDELNLTYINYDYDVTFIGGRNPTREWLIYELKKNNINVECFGAGWKNGKVSYLRMQEIIIKSKINLNLSNSVSHDVRFLKYLLKKLVETLIKIPFRRPYYSLKYLKQYFGSLYYYIFGHKRVETIKARNFEIPGCGGFQLSQFALEIEDYYEIGKELAVFSNVEDLITLIRYFLNDTYHREQIRNDGYKRTAYHVYEKRISEIFEYINNYNTN